MAALWQTDSVCDGDRVQAIKQECGQDYPVSDIVSRVS